MTRLLHMLQLLVAIGLMACGGTASMGSASSESGNGDGLAPGDGATSRDGAANDGRPPLGPRSYRLSVAAIVHPPSGRVYVAAADGGVAAVDVSNGAVEWSSDAADRPLAATDARVVAQEAPPDPHAAGEVRVAVLDADDGSRTARSEPVSLPDWVVPRPWNNGATYAYDSRGHFDGSAFVLEWRAESNPICGGTPESGCSGDARRVAGRARMDPESGRVEGARRLVAGMVSQPWDAPPPAVGVLATRVYGGTIEGSYAVDGATLVGTTEPSGGGERRLHLARWDAETGEEREVVPLTPQVDEATYQGTVPRFSLDARHLVVTRLRMSGRRGAYTRTIYDASTGRALATHDLGAPPQPYMEWFVVVDGVVVHALRDGPLVGTALADGSRLWTVPLREVHEHGMPPSAASR